MYVKNSALPWNLTRTHQLDQPRDRFSFIHRVCNHALKTGRLLPCQPAPGGPLLASQRCGRGRQKLRLISAEDPLARVIPSLSDLAKNRHYTQYKKTPTLR